MFQMLIQCPALIVGLASAMFVLIALFLHGIATSSVESDDRRAVN